MKYQIPEDVKAQREQLRLDRQMQLYKMIFQDVVAIIELLLPADKTLRVKTHAKGLMHSLIELKTGKRVRKF